MMTEEPLKGSISRDGPYAVIRVPMDEIHGLRVALMPRLAGEITSASTQGIRDRLLRGLAALEARGK